MGKYFEQTPATVDLDMVEERVMCQSYTSAAQFRSDFESISLICHLALGSTDTVARGALLLLSLVDRLLGARGLGPSVGGFKRSKGPGSGRGNKAKRGRGGARPLID